MATPVSPHNWQGRVGPFSFSFPCFILVFPLLFAMATPISPHNWQGRVGPLYFYFPCLILVFPLLFAMATPVSPHNWQGRVGPFKKQLKTMKVDVASIVLACEGYVCVVLQPIKIIFCTESQVN